MPRDQDGGANKVRTLGFLVAIETPDAISAELVKQALDHYLTDYNDLRIDDIDVGPLGEIDVYDDEKDVND